MNTVVDTAVNFQPLLNSLLTIIGIVIASVGAKLAVRALQFVERRLHLQVTDQANQVLADEVTNAAGAILSHISAGSAQVSDVHFHSTLVREMATGILNRTYETAGRLGLTKDDVAAKIVGVTMAMISADPTIQTIQPKEPPHA